MDTPLAAVLSALSTEVALVFARHDAVSPKGVQSEIMDLIWRAERDPAGFVAEREAAMMAAITRGRSTKGPTAPTGNGWEAAFTRAASAPPPER